MSGTQGRMAVGHPVDVATGTMFNTWLDFLVGGVVPLTVSRYYSSALASRGASGPLGLGWRHGYQHELRQTVEGFAYVDPTGAEIAIEDLQGELSARGRLVVPRDQVELRGTPDEVELVPYGPGQRFSCWFRRRRGTTRYSLVALGRDESLRLEFHHDGHERLVRVVQKRSGRALSVEHDASGRIARTWFEAEGHRDLAVSFGYDAAGRLETVRDRSGRAWRYAYDRAGLMTSEASNRGALHTFRYDASSRCVYASGADRFEERQLAYFPREHRTEVADSHGAVTTYRFNDAGQVVEVVEPLGARTLYEYDGDGRMTGITDAAGSVGRLEYDRWGHLCAATYPDGKRAITTFDERHLPVAMTDYWGNVWRYEYDARGQLLRSVNPSGHEWSYGYNVHGEVIRIRNPVGAEASRAWDRAGNPCGFRDADGGEWRREFDAYGRCTMERDPAGGVARFQYDAQGAIERIVQPDGRVSEFRRDPARGTQTRSSPAEGQTTTVFNACGKPIERWLPDGSVLRFEWDTEPGRLLSVTDGMGRSLRYGYDAAGQVIDRWDWDGSRTRFERGVLGNVTAVIDAGGGRTEYAYDDWGILSKRISADGAVATYAHDANGLPVRIETDGALVELERDFYGRIVCERQNGVAVTSRYDGAGHRVELRSDLGADVGYDWTPAGACAAVRFRDRSIRFEYDALGREIAAELPGAWRFEQGYDVSGRLQRQEYRRLSSPGAGAGTSGSPGVALLLARQYRYDDRGHLESIADSRRGAARFVHDRLGRLHAVIHPDDRVECYGYDRASNRSFAVRAAGAAAKPLIRELLERGAAEPRELTPGEEVERVDRGGGNTAVQLRRGARTIRYEYDPLGRLVHKHADAPGISEHWSFEWNAAGQLVALVRPDGERWSYRYDGLGRRVAKLGPGGAARTYVWDGPRLLHDSGAGGTATIVTRPNTFSPLLREAGERVDYALLDHLGSVSERVDERGEIVWQDRRGTWGEARAVEEGAPGFPGQHLDAESGLYYNVHRYYDPELGKYISPDPIGLLGGLNDYAYVPSPIEWTDALGLWGGGPYPFTPPTGQNGMPDLRGHREINGYDIPSPGESDKGPKTIAMLTGTNYEPPAGAHPEAQPGFVSGFTQPERAGMLAEARATFPGFVDERGGFGNFHHAEVKALVWAAKEGNVPTTGELHLYIDRPPCDRNGPCCKKAMQHFLENHPLGERLTIHFIYTDPEKKTVEWDTMRKGDAACD